MNDLRFVLAVAQRNPAVRRMVLLALAGTVCMLVQAVSVLWLSTHVSWGIGIGWAVTNYVIHRAIREIAP